VANRAHPNRNITTVQHVSGTEHKKHKRHKKQLIEFLDGTGSAFY
jgi:hypothetical protein